MNETKSKRGKRRILQGVVKSTKMEKTITVQWQRQVEHPRFGKYVRRNTTLQVHDEDGVAKVGDLVEIMETRPISKSKHWRLVKVLHEARSSMPVDVE